MPNPRPQSSRMDEDTMLQLLEESQATNKALQDELKLLRGDVDKLKKPSSGPKMIFDDRKVPRRTEEEFLNSGHRPETEFFAFGSRHMPMTLFIEKKDKNDPTGISKPALQPVFRHWKLAGSDLEKPPFKLPVCRVDLADHPLVTVGEDDIEKYHLKNVRVRDGEYSIEEVLARMRISPAYKNGNVVTGEQFRLMVEEPIRVKWDAEDRLARHKEKLSKYDARERKAANAPELAKAMSE